MRHPLRAPSRAALVPALSAAALALAAGLCAPAHARTLINASWTPGVAGNWANPAMWTPAGSPNNGADTYAVTIAAAPLGGAYTVTNSNFVTITSLLLNHFAATLMNSGGTMTIASSATVTAGTLRNAGTLDLNGGLSVGAGAFLAGGGFWDVAGGDLVNNGTIAADVGVPMAFARNSGPGTGVWDLDGATTSGVVNAGLGDITFNGSLNDAFDGTLSVGAARTLTMTAAWTLGDATVNLTSAGLMAATLAANTITTGTSAITVTGIGVLSAPGSIVLEAGTQVNLNPSSTLVLDGPTTLAGASVAGTGTLTFVEDATTTANTTINTSIVNLGGITGSTVDHTIDAGATLSIHALRLLASGVEGGSYGGTITNNGTLSVLTTGGKWSLDGAINMGDGSVLDTGSDVNVGGVIKVVTGTATVKPYLLFDSNPGIVLDNAGDTLLLSGGGKFTGGTVSGPGRLCIDGNWEFSNATTFNCQMDLDGAVPGMGDEIHIQPGATLNISSDLSTDDYNDTIYLKGALNVTNIAGWTVSTNGSILLVNEGATPSLSVAGAFNMNGLLRALPPTVAGAVTTINVKTTWGADSVITVDAGASLRLGLGGTSEGVFVNGGGRFQPDGNWSFSGSTTFASGSLDWDGAAAGNTFTLDSDSNLFISALFTETMDDNLVLNNATLTLNTNELRVDGAVEMKGAAPLIGGTDIILGGALTINSANAQINAPVSLLGSVGMNAATEKLTLSGATNYNGATVTGIGTLVQNGAATVNSPTTITAALYDWDGTSETTTTTINGALTIDADMIDVGNNGFGGTINNYGTLDVTVDLGQWAVATLGTLNLLSASSRLEGVGVANLGLVTGYGTIACDSYVNRGTLTATGGGNLRINTTLFPDLDGETAAEPGVINAIDGSVEIDGDFGDFSLFNGTLNIGAGRAFKMAAHGLSLENASTPGGVGTMNMTGGTYDAPQFQNRGSLAVTAGVATLKSVSTFLPTGATTIASGAELHINGTARVDPGHSMTGAGKLFVDSGATLSGTGAVAVGVTNNGHMTPGNSVGGFTVTGAYTQGATGSLGIEIGGELAAGADKLTITGAASLAGALNLSLVSGFVPDWGDSWTIATYASRTGDFSSFNLPVLGSNRFWWRAAGATTYTVGVRTAADTNHDGVVDFFDLNNVLSTYNQSLAGTPGMPGLLGDCNEDGVVNFFDLNFVLSLYNQHAALAVPAPGVGALALAGLALGGRRRRTA